MRKLTKHQIDVLINAANETLAGPDHDLWSTAALRLLDQAVKKLKVMRDADSSV